MSGAVLGARSAPWVHRALALLPGLSLLFAVGYAGKLTEQAIDA